ncbi:MAG: pre translocase subunit [Trebouxia sp. A1-2]|nr:MAG: pre translocase subunit [Trebouxia sp. A1-2]
MARQPDSLNVVPEHWKQHMEGLADGKKRALLRYFRIVKEINEQEPYLQSLTDAQLKAKTTEFKLRLRAGATLDDLLVEAFALVREVSSRVLRLRHFDAQMVGGIVLHEGNIAEMKTGEGKTLVATLPTYLNALTGRGVHVVTVNDYLAERDGNWMGRIFKFLGMSVAVATDNMLNSERRVPFAADVTYVTAQVLCFTYLFDNTTQTKNYTAITRPFNYAIVDEVDSLLIDSCGDPLLISAASSENLDRFGVAKEIADELHGTASDEVHYELDHKGKQATLTEAGLYAVYLKLVAKKHIDPVKTSRLMPEGKHEVIVWQEEDPWGPYIINAIKAKELYEINKDYIVTLDKEVHIIDRSSGRIRPRTRWQDNIHQAVEAKENVKVGSDSVTQASITYQCFFRYYPKLAGMTGTAATEAAEFFDVYNLNVVEVPSRLPDQRVDHGCRLYADRWAKLISLYQTVLEAHAQHRPVLIGTSSVAESEQVEGLLKGLSADFFGTGRVHPADRSFSPFWVASSIYADKAYTRKRRRPTDWYKQTVKDKKLALLNAKPENVRREAQIIAQAGLPGAVTIATNMAGRGTDIVLGGNPKGLALQVLMKLFAHYFISVEDYKASKTLLDRVPLDQFSWPEEVSPPAAAASAKAADESSAAAPAAAAPADIAASWSHMEQQLPADLMKRLRATAWVCTTAEDRMSVDNIQGLISKTLDQAEALQTQVLTEHWGGVGNFQVQVHAGPALDKMDELFNNDKILAFQTPKGDLGSQPGRKMTSGMSLPAQKVLAWAAVHLLIFLEKECQQMARRVRDQGGLLVLGTSFHESQRSENQLKGRAARQGDPGETLMMYDLDDAAFRGAGQVSTNMLYSMLAYNEKHCLGDRWCDGILLEASLRPIMLNSEAGYREKRNTLKQFDEVLETFRQHAYSLRRLILNGSNDKSLDMLRMYFQDQADAWVAECIDARKPVRSWNWNELRKRVNKLLDHPKPPSDPAPSLGALPTPTSNRKKGPPLLNVSFVNLNPGQPGPSANPSASQSSPAAGHPPSSFSNGASAPRLPHQQSSHAPQEASSSSSHAPQLQQATPQLWHRVLQLWPWHQHSPPQPQAQPPHPGQSTAGNTLQPGQDPSSQFTQVTEAGKKAFSLFTGSPVEVIPDYMPAKGDFIIDVCSMEEEEVDVVRDALEQNMPLTAPAPFVLDLQYKASPCSSAFSLLLVVIVCFFPSPALVFFSPLILFFLSSALPSCSSHSARNTQAKVAEHRRMLRDSDKTGHRPRIRGRFGTHAEQLRNWLGEYLLAKYDQTCQLSTQRDIAGTSAWERFMMLDTLDDIWMHFLRETSSLQSAVSLRSFSRMDPVQEFNVEAGATFVEALVTFRQDCVYQAFRGPPKEDALRSFFNRLKSQDKPKTPGGALVPPPSSSSSSSGADSTDNSKASASSSASSSSLVSSASPTGSMQVNSDFPSSSVSQVDGSADANTAASLSSGKSDFSHSKEQSIASSTPVPVAHADMDVSVPGSTHNGNGPAARTSNSSAGNGEQKPRSDQESNPDLAELLKLGLR